MLFPNSRGEPAVLRHISSLSHRYLAEMLSILDFPLECRGIVRRVFSPEYVDVLYYRSE